MRTAAAWRAGVASDRGRERPNNEDRVFADEAAGVFLVVDGIGGQAAGEHAAETAVEIISQQMTAAAEGSLEPCVRGAIAAANNRIYELAQSNDEWRGMACVLTLVIARDDRITVGHVGDSRLYLAWDGQLRKLTSDHSPIGESEDSGELSEADAMRHPDRHQVSRDVGSRPRNASDLDFIDVRNFPFHSNAAFLLCSDGLSDSIPSSEISAIIETYDGDAEAVSNRLIEAANEAGGKDNISVVFVAGPEFVGTNCPRMEQARARHAITRVRRTPGRARRMAGRIMLLLAGVALGIVLPRRILPQPSTPPAKGTWIPVSDGDPRGIDKALSAARPGDVIAVPAGEYLGPIQLKDGVTIISRQPGTAVIRVDPAAVADAGIAFVARGIRTGLLSGFRVVGDHDNPLATGVLLDDATLDIDGMDISGAQDCGVRVEGPSSAVLRANSIHDNAGCGVSIRGQSSPRLLANRIWGNGTPQGPGLEIHPPATPLLENNVLSPP
jgi:PPM family protein phosphatase